MGSQVRKIASKEEAQTFAMFLACERNRHLDDIIRAEVDLKNLEKQWGIQVPWDATYFTVVDVPLEVQPCVCGETETTTVQESGIHSRICLKCGMVR